MMVGQSRTGEVSLGALAGVFKMDRGDGSPPSHSQRPPTVETARGDTEQMSGDEDADISSDTVQQPPMTVTQPYLHRSATGQPETDRTRQPVADIPIFTVTDSSTSALTTVLCFQSSTSRPAAAMTTSSDSKGPAAPTRILPLTKRSAELSTRDAAQTSPASPSSSSSSPAAAAAAADLQTYHVKRDVSECSQQTALVPASSSDVFPPSLAAHTSERKWSFLRDIGACAAAAPPTTYEPSQSTIAMQDLETLGLSLFSRSSSKGLPRTARPEPDSYELETKRRRGSDDGNQPPYPSRAADTSVSRQTAETYSSESEAASTHDSPHSDRSTHGGLQSRGDSPKFDPELLEPLSSLHIGGDAAAGGRGASSRQRRRAGGDGGATTSETRQRATHPGCSTLRYKRRHNPGLLRPRVFTCNLPGLLSNLSPPASLRALELRSGCTIHNKRA